MDIHDFSHHLKDIEDDLRRQLEHDLPFKIGLIAQTLFKLNFRKEGFFGKPWLEVKRRLSKGNKAANNRPILTDSGDLGDSIDFEVKDGSVILSSDLAYSSAHNEGTTTAGRSRNVVIPKRQFMGEHPRLTKAIETKIQREIAKALKQ